MQRDLEERIESALSNSGTLRDVSKATRQWLSKNVGEGPLRPLKNLLNGTWLEHPLHPVLTDIPIGGWTTALVLDAATFVFNAPQLGLASGIAVGIGTLGAAGALVTGVMDYMDTDAPEDTTVLTHGLVNLSATLLFAGSFALRQRNRWQTQPLDVALAVVGYAAVTAGGFLGGSLIFRRGVMINRNAYRQAPKKYTEAVALQDLPENKPTRIEVQGEPVVFVRRGEKVYAVGAVCSHYGAPMEEGKLKDDTIICPWHGSEYSILDGSVQAGPTTAPLPMYETRVQDGQVQIRLQTQ